MFNVYRVIEGKAVWTGRNRTARRARRLAKMGQRPLIFARPDVMCVSHTEISPQAFDMLRLATCSLVRPQGEPAQPSEPPSACNHPTEYVRAQRPGAGECLQPALCIKCGEELPGA